MNEFAQTNFVCRLVLDDMPQDAGERFLVAFDLPYRIGEGA